MQLEFAMTLLNKFSMILKDVTLVVTGGKLVRRQMNMVEEKVKCKWQTHGCGNLLQNVKYIL